MKIIIVSLLALWSALYQPAKPKVLIIGDSISIGYFPFVKDALKDKADIYHNAGNAQSTTNGLNKLKSWLKDEQWDVIQFNWGLWDLAYRSPAPKGPGVLDKTNGKLSVTPEQYKKNLEALISVLKETGAKLIFVNTTYVPVNEPGRNYSDVKIYNLIAEELAKKHGITINDLYSPSVKIHNALGLGENDVHYTKNGYKELSKYIIQGIERQLAGFGERALEESAIPVRPGIPGKTPFWNEAAIRFIYAPAFDFKTIENATSYKYEIVSQVDGKTYTFESNAPYHALSPVWVSVPVGKFKLRVVGLSAKGDSLGVAGQGEYFRAAPFNGIYHEPVLPYDKSAELALDNLLNKEYVNYWRTHKAPDPSYRTYRYPSKIFSALIIGAVTSARLNPEKAEQSIELARIIADYLLNITFTKDHALAYFPPTYYGYKEIFDKKPNSHMRYENSMIIYGADAGHAYLDLYDYTKDKKYFEAAKKIADTYLKTQLKNGSWYLFVNNKTGKPTEKPISIPTSTINYFDRLRRDYGVKGLENSTARALKWIMENPVKTFDWHAQFEDVFARPPYKNLSREQACDLAIYLFRNSNGKPENIKLAEELIRFSEDQFVIWEKPEDVKVGQPNPARIGKNWITPSVQEQYVYWMPVGRAAGIMIETYWEAFKATKNDMYLAKAQSIANAFTVVQKAHNGDYPTYFTKYKLDDWLNSVVYPAKVMMNLENNLKGLSNDKRF